MGPVVPHIPDERKQSLRHEKIIEAPANAPLARCQAVRPPCILDSVRVELTVHIHEAMVQVLLDPGAFLRQETGRSDILFGVFEVNGHMGSVEIPGNDEVFPPGM